MKPTDLPEHTLKHLIDHGAALWLAPMEPQPTQAGDKVTWKPTAGPYPVIRWVHGHPNVDADWFDLMLGEYAPYKPGDVLALSGPPVLGTSCGYEATVVSVSPLRLAEITADQLRETGREHPGDVARWWDECEGNDYWVWSASLLLVRHEKM